MNYKKKYSIFISSTYEDLRDERQAVLGVALENNFIPVGMEQFHAAPASQWDVITKMINECDCYLLIVGGRYGSIDDSVGISYTEKEYGYAKSRNLPILVLIRNHECITQDKMDKDDPRHDKFEKQAMLEKFRTRIQNDGNTVDYFDDINGLKYVASQALKNMEDYCPVNAGWARYSDILSIINEKVDEQNSINIEIEEQQESRMDIVETKLNQIIQEHKDVKGNQQQRQQLKPITEEDINNLFRIEGNTLHFGLKSNGQNDTDDDNQGAKQ